MKRKFFIPLILGVMSFSGIAPQLQAQDFWCPNCLYVSGAGALTWMREMDAKVNDLSTGNSFSMISDYKTGYGVNVALGAVFCRSWRLEIEAYFRNNERDKLNINTPCGSILEKPHAHYRSFSLMLNAFYDFYLCDTLTWYLGGGIGPAWVEFKAGPFDTVCEIGGAFPTNLYSFDSTSLDSDTVRFAYQVMTGLAYELTCNIWATMGYRLWGTTERKNHHNNGLTFSERRVPLVQSLEFGLRFMF